MSAIRKLGPYILAIFAGGLVWLVTREAPPDARPLPEPAPKVPDKRPLIPVPRPKPPPRP